MIDVNQLVSIGVMVAGLGILFWGIGAFFRGLATLVQFDKEGHGWFKHK